MFDTRVSGDELLEGVSVADVQAVLQEGGYKAQVGQGDRSPYIHSAISGLNYLVQFYGVGPGCARATSLHMVCGVSMFNEVTKSDQLRIVNKWNLERRFVRLYVDDDSNLRLDFDLPVGGGVTRKTLLEAIEIWGQGLAAAMAFVQSEI